MNPFSLCDARKHVLQRTPGGSRVCAASFPLAITLIVAGAHGCGSRTGDGAAGSKTVRLERLWATAERLKIQQNWQGLENTLESITELDPQDIKAWRLLAWNAAYNLSALPDDV